MSDTPRTFGEAFTIEIEGLDELQRDLDSLSDNIRMRTAVEMVTDAGNAVAEWLRQSIYTTFTTKSTGRLAASVGAQTTSNEKEGAVCLVYPTMYDPKIKYAAIHEYGGDIVPKKAKALRWFGDDDEPIFAKKVHIEEKHYIEPAILGHEEEIVEIMREDLYAAIASDAASI